MVMVALNALLHRSKQYIVPGQRQHRRDVDDDDGMMEALHARQEAGAFVQLDQVVCYFKEVCTPTAT